MANSTNQATEALINHYINNQSYSEHALMINGSWGSGKTHFVKEAVKSEKVIWVSLNGLSSHKSINEEILAQIHPKLHGPQMRLARKLVTGVLSASLKLDLSSSTEKELSIDLTSLADIVGTPGRPSSGTTIIFDDFERCEIPINSLLGYINDLVEGAGCKVIVIADEEKISGLNTYRERKEKVFGLTTRVEPDLANALPSFFSAISDKEIRAFLQSQEELIARIFKHADYNNLRHVKYCLLEFERLFLCHSEMKRLLKSSYATELLERLLILTIEVRKGVIADIESMTNALSYNIPNMLDEDLPEKPSLEINEKYRCTVQGEPIIPASVWFDICCNGVMEGNVINKALLEHEDSSNKAWRSLCDMFQLSTQEFESALKLTIRYFNAGSFTHPFELIHCVSLFRYLIAKGIDLTDDFDSIHHIENIALAHVKDMMTRPELSAIADAHRSSVTNYAGLGFYCEGEQEHIQFVDRFLEVAQATRNKEAIAILRQLPEMLTDKESEVSAHMYRYGEITANCKTIPILQSIDPVELAEAFVVAASKHIDLRTIISFLTMDIKHLDTESKQNEIVALNLFLDKVKELVDKKQITGVAKIKIESAINRFTNS